MSLTEDRENICEKKNNQRKEIFQFIENKWLFLLFSEDRKILTFRANL